MIVCPHCNEHYIPPKGERPQKVKCSRCGKPLLIPQISKPNPDIEDKILEVLGGPRRKTPSTDEANADAVGPQPASEKANTKKCPHCERIVPHSDVLCINCGFDFRTGEIRTASSAANAALASVGIGNDLEERHGNGFPAKASVDPATTGNVRGVRFNLLCYAGTSEQNASHASTSVTHTYKVDSWYKDVPAKGTYTYDLRCKFCQHDVPIEVYSSEVLSQFVLRGALVSAVLCFILAGVFIWFGWTKWYITIGPMLLWCLISVVLMLNCRVALRDDSHLKYIASQQSVKPGETINVPKHRLEAATPEDDRLAERVVVGATIVIAIFTVWIVTYF